MKRKLAALFVLFALAFPVSAAKPDRIVEFHDATLVLQDKPCEIGAILASVEPKLRKNIKGGMVVPKEGDVKPFKLCYVEQKTTEGQAIIGIVDEYGNGGAIEAEAAVPVQRGVQI